MRIFLLKFGVRSEFKVRVFLTLEYSPLFLRVIESVIVIVEFIDDLSLSFEEKLFAQSLIKEGCSFVECLFLDMEWFLGRNIFLGLLVYVVDHPVTHHGSDLLEQKLLLLLLEEELLLILGGLD